MDSKSRPLTTALPVRPRILWDYKTIPWKNAIGDQTAFYEAVCQWQAFYKNLPEGSSNKTF